MTIKEFAREFKQALDGAENVLICLQKSNDIDTTGSAFSLMKLIEENQKNISSVKLLQVNLEKTKIWNLTKYAYWPQHDPKPSEKTLFITVDINANRQIEQDTLKIAQECGKIIRIDHHEDHEDLIIDEEKSEAITLNMPSCCSCCEVIWELSKEMKWKVNQGIGEVIFRGLYADSKKFKSEKVNAQTFKNAAEIFETGANCREVISSLSNHSLRELQIVADLIKETQREKEMAIVNLNPEIIHKYYPKNFRKHSNGRIAQIFLITFPLNIIEDLLNTKIIFYIHYSLIAPFDGRKKFLFVVLKEPNPKIESILLEEGFYKHRNRFSRAIYFSKILELLTKYRDIFSEFSQN